MKFRVLLLGIALLLILPSCSGKTSAPDDSPSSDSVLTDEALTEEATQAETEDVFADVDVEGHTLLLSEGKYYLTPKIQATGATGQIEITTIVLGSLDELRDKLANGGFTESDYRIMSGWNMTEKGIEIPDPNALRDVEIPENWTAKSVYWTASRYSINVTPIEGKGYVMILMLPIGQYDEEYEYIYGLATNAMTKDDGSKNEGYFNSIPCTIYEFTTNQGYLNRKYWMDLSTETESLFALVTILQDRPDVGMVRIVGKTEDGCAFTASFECGYDDESLKVYTADFFRSFRPAPLK